MPAPGPALTPPFRDTFTLAHNAHLLLGIYEDEAGGKLLHGAGMRCSNGPSDLSRDMPIAISQKDGIAEEPGQELHRL